MAFILVPPGRGLLSGYLWLPFDRGQSASHVGMLHVVGAIDQSHCPLQDWKG